VLCSIPEEARDAAGGMLLILDEAQTGLGKTGNALIAHVLPTS
jgi:acetylornithine/succinyldiaminopimelate/putrescine aminotransferase